LQAFSEIFFAFHKEDTGKGSILQVQRVSGVR